ncbi:MAG: peptide ABC transporter substrate-binding protein [Pseudomonadota bacterium]|nr:peptide ABC transporter substrate-binding protein [Pseudomonadota bacterium]
MIRALNLGFLFAISVAIFGCGRHEASAEGRSVLHRGLSGEPSTLDPASSGDNFSAQVLQDVYEGLTAETSDGTVVPAVASSWTVEPDGLRYTFHLRSTARWSNGNTVRAQDFVAAWRRVVDPKQGSPVADNLRAIHGAPEILAGRASPLTLGVSAPSDDTLVVNLDLPTPYLPEILSHSVAFPIYSDSTARTHDPAAWVSNGAYVLTLWQNGSSIELKQNPEYWDRANVHIPRVEFQFASDENTQYAQYRAGELDMTDVVPASAVPSLRESKPRELIIAPFLATAYYGLNLASQPLGSQVKLRQALSMAIDRRRLVDSFGFGQPPAYSFIPAGIWKYEQQSYSWKTLPNKDRVQQARQLYAAAGFSIETPLHLRVLFNSNVVIKRTAIMIAAMWKEELGIDCELMEEEYRSFLISRHDRTRWDVARLAWVADFNDANNFLETLSTPSNNNDEKYSNSGFDKLIERASLTADASIRRSILESAERLMLDDYPIIPLYHFVSKRLVKPYVHGVHPSPTDRVPSKAISISVE